MPVFEILPIGKEIATELSGGKITALEIEKLVQDQYGLPLMRDLALDAIKGGFTDIEAVREVIAMTI